MGQSAERSNCMPNLFVSETLRKLYEMRTARTVTRHSGNMRSNLPREYHILRYFSSKPTIRPTSNERKKHTNNANTN